MAEPAIYLFPDTNLLVQCRTLHALDWAGISEGADIELIMTRPVVAEIDRLKTTAGRLGRKARDANSLLRKVVVEGTNHVVRESGPRVVLTVRQDLLPDPALAGRLDYALRDDQLVGTAHAFAKAGPGSDVRLFTHDTGPMATARMIELAFLPVPDDWLLDPEKDQSEKQLAALEAENARLRRAEPAFEIGFLDGSGAAAERLQVTARRYDPLTDDEVDAFMTRIRERHAPATDFGSREASEDSAGAGIARSIGIRRVYVPATDEEIASYRDEKYPAWLDECERLLRDHHVTLQHREGQPSFAFVITNTGTRPGTDALVEVEALGNFDIMPPPDRRDQDDEYAGEERAGSPALPPPPHPPRGRSELVTGGLSALHGMRSLERTLGIGAVSPFAGSDSFRIPDLIRKPVRDPNAFYWKPQRPMIPGRQLTLECDQWRHGIEAEQFEGEIVVGDDGVSGALECRVHAGNLSEPAIKRVPVRIEAVRARAYDSASQMVDRLCADPFAGLSFRSSGS